jgi:hypothetical protein
MLGMLLVAGATPAWSSTACPSKSGAASGGEGSTTVKTCAEEELEAQLQEAREEALEAQEDEEESQALGSERSSGAARDAAEEAAEEAEERKAGGGGARAAPTLSGRLTLKIKVKTVKRRSHVHPQETDILVITDVPAQIGVLVRDRGQDVHRYSGETANRHTYLLRVPWTCTAGVRRYRFIVTADVPGKPQLGSRRRTVSSRVCGRSPQA